MRNVSDKRCRENQNKLFVFNNCFSENRSVYEIMWKNAGATQVTGNNIIRRVRFACWITKATDTRNI